MKKILVPTDFSKNALNAVKYAIEMAQLLEGEITLLHTYKVYSTTGMFISVESFLKKDAARQMLEVYEFVEQYLGKERVDSKIVKGDVVAVITNMANKQDVDLVIMGTQGASGLAEVFTGTNTNGVVKKSRKPVLAIPENYQFRPLQNIVLAVDQQGISFSKILKPLVTIAQQSDALVRIFHKDTGEEDPGIDPSVEMFLESVEHSFHYELDTDNLNESINQFVVDYKADMLCMIRRQRSFMESVFHVSATTKEVFECSVPLLILQEEPSDT